MVDLAQPYRASAAVSAPIFSKMSLMNEFMMDIAFEEIPVSCGQQLWLIVSDLQPSLHF